MTVLIFGGTLSLSLLRRAFACSDLTATIVTASGHDALSFWVFTFTMTTLYDEK
jgi:hypothetical protein